jgi:hypothetical protein
MSRRTSNMSDYEPDNEEQPTERRSSYADRGNVPISNHGQQRTLQARPQVRQQVPPQLQSAQRKFFRKFHFDIQTDA